jgi:hypothetical protein
MNLDFVAEYLRSKTFEGLHVIGFPDTGLFLDGSQFPVSKDWYKRMQVADSLWGSTKAGNSNEGCLKAYPGDDSWKCTFG